jgi:hypothetical protein
MPAEARGSRTCAGGTFTPEWTASQGHSVYTLTQSPLRVGNVVTLMSNARVVEVNPCGPQVALGEIPLERASRWPSFLEGVSGECEAGATGTSGVLMSIPGSWRVYRSRFSLSLHPGFMSELANTRQIKAAQNRGCVLMREFWGGSIAPWHAQNSPTRISLSIEAISRTSSHGVLYTTRVLGWS